MVLQWRVKPKLDCQLHWEQTTCLFCSPLYPHIQIKAWHSWCTISNKKMCWMNEYSAFGNCSSIAIESKNYTPFRAVSTSYIPFSKPLYTTTVRRSHLSFQWPSAHNKATFPHPFNKNLFKDNGVPVVMNARDSNEAYVQWTEKDPSNLPLNKLRA